MHMDNGVLLDGDGALCIDAYEIADNLSAGIIVECESDTLNVDAPECGYQHRGTGFYHYATGCTFADLL
jgi:hypothetical protein